MDGSTSSLLRLVNVKITMVFPKDLGKSPCDKTLFPERYCGSLSQLLHNGRRMEEGTGHKLDLHITTTSVLSRAVGPGCAGGQGGWSHLSSAAWLYSSGPGGQAKKMDPVFSATPMPLLGLVKPTVPPLWK